MLIWLYSSYTVTMPILTVCYQGCNKKDMRDSVWYTMKVGFRIQHKQCDIILCIGGSLFFFFMVTVWLSAVHLSQACQLAAAHCVYAVYVLGPCSVPQSHTWLPSSFKHHCTLLCWQTKCRWDTEFLTARNCTIGCLLRRLPETSLKTPSSDLSKNLEILSFLSFRLLFCLPGRTRCSCRIR